MTRVYDTLANLHFMVNELVRDEPYTTPEQLASLPKIDDSKPVTPQQKPELEIAGGKMLDKSIALEAKDKERQV